MKQLYQRIEMDKTSKKNMKPSQNTTEVCHIIISNDCTHGEYVFEQKKAGCHYDIRPKEGVSH